MLLQDKVVLVTGASRGIGRATALRCAREGAVVFANARCEGALDSLAHETPGLHPLYFDVRDVAAAKAAIMHIHKEQKRLDVLVNNAGIMRDALIGMVARDALEDIFATNVFATVELLQLSARLMKRQQSGSIINLSSIVGMRGNAGQLAYSASKGAVASLTKTAAHELGAFGIRVNAVAPGYIDTDMFNSVPEEARKSMLGRVSLGRLGTPDDVANVCVFLASDLSLYVSGQIIGVDGDVA